MHMILALYRKANTDLLLMLFHIRMSLHALLFE